MGLLHIPVEVLEPQAVIELHVAMEEVMNAVID